MFSRPFWLKRIEETWKKVPIAWLSGVRRVGKTSLAKEFKDALFMNCDLQVTADSLKDPERFYESVKEPIIIFDEIHKLEDPSRILKIGADVYPHFRILATGSSTLAATSKFSDSLTGRKRAIHLVPVLPIELENFGIKDLKERLLKGGLPPALLAEEIDHSFYAEWIDSFFARDVQELFRVEKRSGFLRLLEILIKDNAGLVQINNLANYAGITASTVNNYLQMLETTHAVYCLRPFHGGGTREVTKQPKYYAFDTGFVAYFHGWNSLRPDDCGDLLENLALETLLSIPQLRKINFWRDKEKTEIDFVCPREEDHIDAIECKWSSDAFEIKPFIRFRSLYPKGKNYVVSSQVGAPYTRRIKDIPVTFVSIYDFQAQMTASLEI